ncbi:FAD:protein FMN transferase [Labilibacter sediminis]|nr:FAD:protein FMN transferase [Labilibacter sediminis]
MKHLCLLLLVALFISCQPKTKEYVKIEGMIFGTFYHIVYQPVGDERDLSEGISQSLNNVDWSLSTYKDTSTISRFSQSTEGIEIDSLMKTVYLAGKEVYENTYGAFDMTVGALVNAWGFGFKKQDMVTTALVDSLLMNVGMDMLSLKDGFLHKSKPNIVLDASAIAKGFGVDVVADYLVAQGIKNYMVEIGGEIRVKGKNSAGTHWRVGIDKPIDDMAAKSRELQGVISLTNVGLATSGNYRNFYIRDGKKYAHTIDPKTGYPVQHSLLSASIVAPLCMNADAYATACMVMGLEKSMELIESLPNTEGYFIYVDENGNNQVSYTSGFGDLIVE